MGEIGYHRREFLHDIKWWEVKSIIRGYHARHHAGWEQARLVAYNARFCMGSKEPIPLINKWISFPWEEKRRLPISKSEIADMLAEMDAINAEAENESKPQS